MSRLRLLNGVARTASILVLVSALLILLTTCEIFFLSPFPAYLGELEAETDISSVIPPEPLGSYTLRFASRGAGREGVVVLYVESPTTGISVHFYTESLSYLGSLEDDPADPNDGLFANTIYDPGGYLYIGRRAIRINDDLSDAAVSTIDIGGNGGYFDTGDGIATTMKPVITMRTFGGLFEPTGFHSLGTPNGTGTFASLTMDASGVIDRFAGVFHDVENGEVALIFSNGGTGGGSVDLFYALVRSDTDLIDSLPDPIFGGAVTPTVVSVPDFDGGEGDFVYTRRGFVAQTTGNTLTAYSLSGEELGDRPGELRNEEIAFGIDGESYFLYDTDESVLRRVRTWW